MSRVFPMMLGGCMVAWSAAAQMPPPSLQGDWTLDVARSTMPPGEPPPRSSTMQVTADNGSAFAWSQTTVAPDGKSSTVSWRGAFDGRPYPMTGGGTMSFTRLTPTSFHDEGSDPSGARWTETCTLGADQRTLTCQGSQTDPRGGNIAYTDVWHR